MSLGKQDPDQAPSATAGVDPSTAETRAEFALCLRELKTAAGRSLTQIARASARAPHPEWAISRATAGNLTDPDRATRGVGLTRESLHGFLTGCGLTDPAQRERWLHNYDNLYGPPPPDSSAAKQPDEKTPVGRPPVGRVIGDLAKTVTGAELARAAQPYLLLETGEAVGRQELRAKVRGHSDGMDGGSPLLLLVGVAGIGKSALAWDGWKRLDASVDRRKFWYSFYSGRGQGTFANLLDELGRFLGAASSSVDDVFTALAAQDVVMFLDGIERCLRCYQRPLAVGDLEAMELQDREASGWTDLDLSFASEEMARFFITLLELPSARVIATSRVVPSDYFASGGGIRAGVSCEMVGPFAAPETEALLTAVGLAVDPVDAAGLTVALGGHPLAMQLVARRASRSASAAVGLGEWLARNGYSRAEGAGVAEIRRRLFADATAGLSVTARHTLVIAGVLGGAVELPALQELLTRTNADADDELAFDAVEEVATAGLGVHGPRGQLACHPLTVSAAADQLDRAQTETLLNAISDVLRRRFTTFDRDFGGYFEWFTKGATADRTEAMALCRALTRLGAFEDAAGLYFEQLDLPIRFVLGANFEAMELLQLIVAGLDSLKERRPYGVHPHALRAVLAFHMLMIGHLELAESTLMLIGGKAENAAPSVAAEIALHRGDLVRALRIATDELHDSRVSLSWVVGEDMDSFQMMGSRFEAITNDPVSHLVEASVICARVLSADGRRAEAAMLLIEGFRQRNRVHKQCDACFGLLVRAAAELLLDCGDRPGAVEAASLGRRLQQAQGRELQGLLTDVVLGMAGEAPPGLAALLSGAGFVLYELLLRAASGSDLRAVQALEQLGAGYLLRRRTAPASGVLPDTDVARCVGWVAGELADQGQPETPDLGEPASLTDADQAAVRQRLALALAAQAAAQAVPGDWIPATHRQRARIRSGEGDAEASRAALERAAELDPCDVNAFAALAKDAANRGDEPELERHLRHLFAIYSSRWSYEFGASLVDGDGPRAELLRTLLQDMVEVGHSGQWALHALTGLERRLGNTEAATRAEQRIETYGYGTVFSGYANNPYEEPAEHD